jgi:hypothetical protein
LEVRKTMRWIAESGRSWLVVGSLTIALDSRCVSVDDESVIAV